jgi:hypothetical protein
MPHASLMTKKNNTKARRAANLQVDRRNMAGVLERTGVVCSADELLNFLGFVVNGNRNRL